MNVLCFGEILWDIIGDKKCIGGAPFNVACHLARMGNCSYILSAAGNDELGKAAVQCIKDENVKTDFLTIHDSIPTGTATVFVKDGIPDYAFNEQNAWDNILIEGEKLDKLVSIKWDVFYFGTLAQRSDISRNTLIKVMNKINSCINFLDVNFRKKFYSKKILETSLHFANILKINDEELPALIKTMELSQLENKETGFLCMELCRLYNLKGIILTSGKNGAEAYFNGIRYFSKPQNVKVVDTVGAGDSLSAAFINAYVNGSSIDESLKKGTALADFVVQHTGALPK